MKIFVFLIVFFLLTNCNKPKTVLICGDHVCINKTEARQYFENNLSIEVKIIENKIKKEIDLVELNLRKDNTGNRQISIKSKETTNKSLKVLSDNEISEIKQSIKVNKKNKKIAKKSINKKSSLKSKINDKDEIKDLKNYEKNKINDNKKRINIVDVCTLIEKCSIDNVSKFLLMQAKEKDFPDITKRQ